MRFPPHPFTRPLAALALCGLAAILATGPSAAQTTVYDNTTDGGNYFLVPGGASGSSATKLVADDIAPLSGYGGATVTEFRFSVVNGNDSDVTVTPTAYFYSLDSTGRLPGALLAAVPVGPLLVPHNSDQFLTETSTAGFFTLPAGTFFAGIAFSGAPASQLNEFGQLEYGTPTVGSTLNRFFVSGGPATNASNPPGILASGGNFPSNFAWQFQVSTAPVPEASTTLSFGLLLAFGLGGLVVAARRKKGVSSL